MSVNKKTNRKPIIYFLIIVIIFVGALVVLSKKKDKGIEVKTAVVTRGDIKAYLSTTATVESKSRNEYYGIQAKVNLVKVKVGDKVKKGEVLAVFETSDLINAARQAQIQYSNAVLQREDLLSQNKAINSKIDALDKQINTLQSSGNISDKAMLENLQQQKASLLPISNEKIELSNNSVDLAKLAYTSAREKVRDNKGTIYAIADGVVTDVNITAGTMGNGMQPAIVVQDVNNLKAEVSLGKYDASKIKIGQKVIITNGDKTYRGIISTINPVATKTMAQGTGEASLSVEINILDKAPDLKIDFDVDVDILVGEAFNVIKMPAEALKIEKDNKNLAYVVDGKIAHERAVTPGLSSDTEVEIKSGLKPSEVVILNPTTTITEGVRVKGEQNAGD